MKKISNFAVVFYAHFIFGLLTVVSELRKKFDNLKTNIIN